MSYFPYRTVGEFPLEPDEQLAPRNLKQKKEFIRRWKRRKKQPSTVLTPTTKRDILRQSTAQDRISNYPSLKPGRKGKGILSDLTCKPKPTKLRREWIFLLSERKAGKRVASKSERIPNLRKKREFL